MPGIGPLLSVDTDGQGSRAALLRFTRGTP